MSGRDYAAYQFVVIVDTCSLLDIVRMPQRAGRSADPVSVNGITAAATGAAPSALIVIPELMHAEYGHRIGGVCEDVKSYLRRLQHELLQIHEVAKTLLGFSPIAEDLDLGQVVHVSRDLADQVIALSVMPQATETERYQAERRVVRAVPPATRGSSSQTDSTLCEIALNVALTRAPRTTALLTSNDRDFCVDKHLHIALQDEFDKAGLLFVRSWAATFGTMKDAAKSAPS